MRVGPPGNRWAHHRPDLARAGLSAGAGESQHRGGRPGNGRSGRAPRGARPPPHAARCGTGERFKTSVFEVQRSLAPSGGEVAKGREARGAAGRGHGQDAPFERPSGRGWGWRLAHADALEALREQGHRPTVIRGFYRPCVSTDPGLASPGVGVRIAECNRDGWAPGEARGMGPRVPHVFLRERLDPEPWWRELWRVGNPRRAPTGDLGLARHRGRRRTDSQGE